MQEEIQLFEKVLKQSTIKFGKINENSPIYLTFLSFLLHLHL